MNEDFSEAENHRVIEVAEVMFSNILLTFAVQRPPTEKLAEWMEQHREELNRDRAEAGFIDARIVGATLSNMLRRFLSILPPHFVDLAQDQLLASVALGRVVLVLTEDEAHHVTAQLMNGSLGHLPVNQAILDKLFRASELVRR